MSSKATLRVRCSGGELFAACDIDFGAPVFRFTCSIAAAFALDSGASAPFHVAREWKPDFRPLCQEITFTFDSPSRSLHFAYRGKVEGWTNIIEEKRTALSMYSAWSPFEADPALDISVEMLDMADYFVLNGRYNEATSVWTYERSHSFDPCNIIALRKDSFYTECSGGFTFYSLAPDERELGRTLVDSYAKIMEYYASAFYPIEQNKFDFVSLDVDGGGAYYRDQLIVSDSLKEIVTWADGLCGTVMLLAHELGHAWFMGAATNSWEDWLNETGANWASLLYALHIGDDALFDAIIKMAENTFAGSPPIKSIDGSRPAEGVHSRGTMLFLEIYRKYGADAVLAILRCLAAIAAPTTERLLAALRKELGDEIPDIIEKGLTMTDFSQLF